MEEKPQQRKFYHPLMTYLNRERYTYYTTPDGQDLLKKLWYTSKFGGFIGLLYGGFVSLTTAPPPEKSVFLLVDTARRGFPFLLFPMVYTTTTYAMTNLRNKDDVVNAAIGGGLAGVAFGVWHRNGGLTLVAAIAGAIACGLKKRTVELGIQFPVKNGPRIGDSSWTLRNLDFTLTKDIPDWKPRY